MNARLKLIIGFIVLETIDIVPFPITTIVAIYIVWKKPLWFKNLVMELYEPVEPPNERDRND